jgi:hypothetical protein
LLASYYLAVTGAFLVTLAAILVTTTVYIFGMAIQHLALRKLKLWKMIRIDAMAGAVLLLVLALAYWAKQLSNLSESGLDTFEFASTRRLTWLYVIVDGTMAALTAGLAGLAIYLVPKVKKKLGAVAGNVCRALLSPTRLWYVPRE